MTPERLIIKVMSELHREGISPNLENIDSEQVHQTAERLLKLLGGLTEPEVKSIEAPPPLPSAVSATVGRTPAVMPRDSLRHSTIDSPTRLMPVIQPQSSRPPPTPTPTPTRYNWGRADAYPA